MNEEDGQKQGTGRADPRNFRARLTPHRSLSPRGFLILMFCIGGVSFIAGTAFLLMGAWPVFGFFGLDVLLIYIAFKLNYRSGRAFEIVEVTPEFLRLTRVSPAGAKDVTDFNPYWVKVLLSEAVDGRTQMGLALHNREAVFGTFLTDDERREFTGVLRQALIAVRSPKF